MKYMLMINANEAEEHAMSEEAMGQLMQEYGQYSKDLQEAGVMVDGARLQPTSAATTVRVRQGEAMLTDGPFAETKEQFGGFYTIDVPDLDAAIHWARRCPSAVYGSIEIRPLWEHEG